MDRRLLFPAVAVTAWAQQQPAPVANEAEQALRARVEQFYQLQVDKKFRQSEAMVAEDSKDDFYNTAKPDIKEFSVAEVELSDNDTHAKVTLKGKFLVRAPFGSQVFEMPAVSFWKIENGQWVWYINRDIVRETPFGKINPKPSTEKGDKAPSGVPVDVAGLMNAVTLDKMSISLTRADPVQTVTVSNSLSGPVKIDLKDPHLEGISIELEKSDLQSGEKSKITFRLTGEAKSAGVVRMVASPLNKLFEIQVHSN